MAEEGGSGLLVAGRLVLVAGLVIVVVGLALLLLGRQGWQLRPLPGDIVIRRPGLVIYFPLVTMLVISLILTLIWQFIAFLRR